LLVLLVQPTLVMAVAVVEQTTALCTTVVLEVLVLSFSVISQEMQRR
jgi:hypothetical protein